MGNEHESTSTEFNTGDYLVELQRLWILLQRVEDDDLRTEISDQISRLQKMIRPPVDAFLDQHPEARTHQPSIELLYRFDTAD